MPLTLQRTVDTVIEPVTYHEACAHLRVDIDVEQDYITALITAARQWVEEATQRQLVTATWALSLDTFPCTEGVIRLPRPRLISVTSIVYLDANGVSQTLGASSYQVDAVSEPARIIPTPGVIWPTTEWRRQNAVTITYTAGYGAAAVVPNAIKQAIKILVAHWFENREPVIVGTSVVSVPMSVDALLGPYRVMTVY